MGGVKLLIAGDLHIGRSSSRVGSGIGIELRSRDCWVRIVESAIAQKADLVCLTGDIMDESNQFWEARGTLEAGIERLDRHGIFTVAISGNHDHEALPRFAELMDPEQFRLLGKNGKWERYTHHDKDGIPVVHIDGWSYPHRCVRSSPVDSYGLPVDPLIPTLAMVHGDLDVPTSQYAPLRRQDLRSIPIAGWLLGHIHAPMCDNRGDDPVILYPGSPQALDPGESGEHGVVLASIDSGVLSSIDRIAVSSVRYDTIEIDLTGVEYESGYTKRVLDAIHSHASAVLETDNGMLRHLSLRLHLIGRTSLATMIRNDAPKMIEIDHEPYKGLEYSIDTVRLNVLPEIDLHEYARSNSPPGMLSRLLLEIQESVPVDKMEASSRRLIAEARARIEQQRNLSVYRPASSKAGEVSESEVMQVVRDQAESILMHLLEPNHE